MSFVDTLRDTVGKDTAQINAQTQALGTDVPSNLGGLTGSEGYFTQRYQTTPVEAQVNTLKATAQAKALNDLMTNYQNQLQNKYNQAYRSYQKRPRNSGGSAGGSNNSNGGNSSTWDGDFEEKTSDNEEDNKVGSNSGKTTPPNIEDYYVTGEEQTKLIEDRSSLPEWLVNVLKIFGAQ